MGRVKHFVEVVSPLNFFYTNSQILEAQRLVEGFQMREEIAKNLNSKILITKEERDKLINA